MKKQYVQPEVCKVKVQTESLLYTTSINYGGEDDEQPVDAKRTGRTFWEDGDEPSEPDNSNFWDW
ncbi:MAG: hypothetical protein IJ166_03715 [Prevotella sp.]|nr:hypothetical protein [Prevotella sp.]